MTYVVGCDNAAVAMKNMIMELLKEKGIEVENAGCDTMEDKTNYPIIAKKVCEIIVESGYKKRGILVCGTGIGMTITANKFSGIRAALCHDIYSAERSVLSNDANVLCLGARVIGPELAKKIVNEWIMLEYKDGPSTPKIQDICEIERENMRLLKMGDLKFRHTPFDIKAYRPASVDAGRYAFILNRRPV